MLLHHDHCKGKKSFSDLRTVDGDQMESYQEVCRALGLLQDDREWDEALNEGALTCMPAALRELYITILMFCMPSNPKELFEAHYLEWADDFERDARKRGKSLRLSEKNIGFDRYSTETSFLGYKSEAAGNDRANRTRVKRC